MTVSEMAKFQGLTMSELARWKVFVSATKFKFALGNAMSGNVMHRLIPRALKAAGLITDYKDPWENKGFKWFKP
jgi:hypothetical protein